MIKFLGALSIFSSVLLFIYRPAAAMKKRMNLLFALSQAFHRISSELETNLTALPELLRLMNDSALPAVQPIFSCVSATIQQQGAAVFQFAWKQALKPYRTQLEEQEFQSLLQLGNVLGCYLAEDQITAIGQCIQILDEGYRATRSQFCETQRVYVGVGASIGISVVILLA